MKGEMAAFFIDDIQAASLDVGQCVGIRVRAGQRVLTQTWPKRGWDIVGDEASWQAGQSYYYVFLAKRSDESIGMFSSSYRQKTHWYLMKFSAAARPRLLTCTATPAQNEDRLKALPAVRVRIEPLPPTAPSPHTSPRHSPATPPSMSPG